VLRAHSTPPSAITHPQRPQGLWRPRVLVGRRGRTGAAHVGGARAPHLGHGLCTVRCGRGGRQRQPPAGDRERWLHAQG